MIKSSDIIEIRQRKESEKKKKYHERA